MKTENLRNKYKNHPIIKPIIEYCEEKHIGFEFIKETRLGEIGVKSFKYVSSYYMKIGDHLVETESKLWCWTDLFKLLVTAYKHIGLEYPENLVKAARAFGRPI
ncbi:MAG: hypothetical protein A2287_11065 [Candidatus Melainabacteria bacterium RIFOXYA12_FULL_32_12]|nr:MAG: hypothetical protein A2255_02640 [Candidatus Melainabacteria bacterium RIFOXYA2_FULL_32_9]OGI30485.1 MAG: hypothetical protein A2287_11065 [Candidatus Melainabacteria bacterium RIFOXYA12_FULL_32_12]